MKNPIPRWIYGHFWALALLASPHANAHTVWIEPDKDKLVVRFAEPGNELETSPGHLDGLSAQVACVLVTNLPTAITVTKHSDHFLLVGASTTKIACVETIFTIRGGRKPYFYARWQPTHGGACSTSLTLDLVPTGSSGEVRAFFRGKPLGNVKALLRTPDEKEQELIADAEGYLRFKAEQSGKHLLTIAHYREPLAGFYGGTAYEQTSHNAALSWVQP